MRARVTGDEVGERVGDGFEEGGRDADGQRNTESIAQASDNKPRMWLTTLK